MSAPRPHVSAVIPVYNEEANLPELNERMVAINAALEVDLTGQVCADSLGSRFYSGIGGQVDFIRGAARSPGGKPIIALHSTAKNGTVSRIVPHLQEGAGVVTTRGDVHYVVTEYGIADLWGRTVRQRVAPGAGHGRPTSLNSASRTFGEFRRRSSAKAAR